MISRPRIGLLGVGPMAAHHARALKASAGIDLALSVSRDSWKAAAFAAEHGIPRSTSLEQFKAAPDVDGLYVVVPAAHMLDVAIDLWRLRIPLMLEKPVGLGPEGTRRAAETITGPNMVGVNRRFYEVIQRGKAWIEQHGGPTGIEIQMPEDIRLLGDRYGTNILETWMFGNSVHLIDLFRYFCGEAKEVHTLHRQSEFFDRSVATAIAFESGAVGVFHAHWASPGGWRVAVTARDTQVVFQPIEKATVLERGQPAKEWLPTGQDASLKAGLYGQAEAFGRLVADGRLPAGAVDLRDYSRSVDLVSRIFDTDREHSDRGFGQ